MWAREYIAVEVVGSERCTHTYTLALGFVNPVEHRFSVISICWAATWGNLLALGLFHGSGLEWRAQTRTLSWGPTGSGLNNSFQYLELLVGRDSWLFCVELNRISSVSHSSSNLHSWFDWCYQTSNLAPKWAKMKLMYHKYFCNIRGTKEETTTRRFALE